MRTNAPERTSDLKLRVTALIVPLLVLALAMPAAAAPGDNPNELCGEENIYLEQTPFGTFALPIPSHGGCVSSWATGVVSTSAYVAQCRFLEANFFDYPYSFYGRYPAKNRADCVRYLRGFHTGTLEPGPG